MATGDAVEFVIVESFGTLEPVESFALLTAAFRSPMIVDEQERSESRRRSRERSPTPPGRRARRNRSSSSRSHQVNDVSNFIPTADNPISNGSRSMLLEEGRVGGSTTRALQGVSNAAESSRTPSVNENYRVGFALEGLVVKDPVKRDFKLTTKTRYEVWLDQMNSELRARGLLDLTDTSAFTFRRFSETENHVRKGYARDIILQRIDDSYKNKLMDLVDPKDLMFRVKQIKDAETSCNPNTVIRDLSSLIYDRS